MEFKVGSMLGVSTTITSTITSPIFTIMPTSTLPMLNDKMQVAQESKGFDIGNIWILMISGVVILLITSILVYRWHARHRKECETNSHKQRTDLRRI